MHGHGGLAAARHSLYDHALKGNITDDLVLFLLNGGNDISQHHVLILRQILDQQLVVGGHITVVVAIHDAIFDVESSL